MTPGNDIAYTTMRNGCLRCGTPGKSPYFGDHGWDNTGYCEFCRGQQKMSWALFSRLPLKWECVSDSLIRNTNYQFYNEARVGGERMVVASVGRVLRPGCVGGALTRMPVLMINLFAEELHTDGYSPDVEGIRWGMRKVEATLAQMRQRYLEVFRVPRDCVISDQNKE